MLICLVIDLIISALSGCCKVWCRYMASAKVLANANLWVLECSCLSSHLPYLTSFRFYWFLLFLHYHYWSRASKFALDPAMFVFTDSLGVYGIERLVHVFCYQRCLCFQYILHRWTISIFKACLPSLLETLCCEAACHVIFSWSDVWLCGCLTDLALTCHSDLGIKPFHLSD